MTDVDGVILAAGLSSRSKQYKMTLPLGERTVIEVTVDGMLPCVGRVIVVLGWQAERLRVLLQGRQNVELIYNAQFREGMFSSVCAGIVEVKAARFFLLPGDQPLIGPEVYARLLSTPGAVVIPTYRGRKGHPVLLERGLVPQILAQGREATLRDIIERTGYKAVEVEDEGILLDVDTEEDYDAVLRRYRAQQGQPREQDA